MTDFLTGALKARGAFWLKCKKPLKMHFRGLLINSVVVPVATPFRIFLDSKIHFLRVIFTKKKEKMARKKKIEMEIVNYNAAGIDVGSRSHFVAVGQSLEDVKEFGVYAEDLVELCEWLLSYGITSVAMESTGDY